MKTRAWKVRGDRILNDNSDHIIEIDYGINGITEKISREDLKLTIKDQIPDGTNQRINAYTSQLWTSINDVKLNDYILLPKEKGKLISIGKVTKKTALANNGNTLCFYISWIRQDVPLSTFNIDLQYSFKAIMRFCEIKRNNATTRIEALANGRSDPGF